IFEGENRMMVNSPKVATYDLKPEMSALELADAACEVIEKDAPDFICLNFANPDMVGHTGVYAAIVKAVETTDRCLEQVYRKAREHNYSLVIIADHGNADQALNDDGTPNTAHSVNPVPIIVQTSKAEALQNGILADVAPTILEIMGVDKPEEMTGKSLLISKQ
ncbi:MAG: alkaline phosphatase family protein, partial [Luteibaculum sp.]